MLLYSDEIPNVRSLFVHSSCIFVHKNLKIREYVNHIHETRSKINKHLIVPISNTNSQLQSVNYLFPKIYNALPCDLTFR